MTRSPNLEDISTRLQRIAQLAEEDRKRVFMSLAHHIDRDLLREACRLTRKDGAPGVDGQTATAYEENLEENLQSLLDRFKSGGYKAPPVRRVYIPKGSDLTKTRPIGVPTFEDKVLQRAVTMVLEAVYEQDFLDCSYGFRPGRSAHQAIGDLRMRREFHVRFCEGAGVRFPRATRLVLVFQLEADARRVLEVLPKRFDRYVLHLHPDKTRLLRFERPRPDEEPRQAQPHEEPRSFDFLGFTHYWEKSRRGYWVVKRKTASDRLTRSLKRINLWCQENRHNLMAWQHGQLLAKLRGHYGYYGITGNSRSLSSFYHWVKRIWRKWLSRRSRTSNLNWERFNLLLKRYPLPTPRICQPG